MMQIEVNGDAYGNFTSAEVEIRLDALSNTFSFTAVSTKGTPLPFKGGESCRILVEGVAVLTGSIEVVEGSYDSRSHSITIRGRDKTGDLVDSSISSLSDLKAPISLKEIIEKVINNIGSDITVIDEASPDPFNKAEDLTAPEAGVGAFEFIEGLSRKRQVLLTSNSSGDIVIVKTPGTVLNELTIQSVSGAIGNNVLGASYSYDLTGRYNVYKMSSSLNPVAIAISSTSTISEMVNQFGEVLDDNVRKGRQLAVIAEGPYSSLQNVSRAEWERRIREARGQLYSATVNGYLALNTGKLWEINTVINIFDELAGVTSEMLINSITYNLNLDTGKTTTLSLVEKNAYNLELQQPTTQKLGTGLA